jgi:hypothetical protein
MARQAWLAIEAQFLGNCEIRVTTLYVASSTRQQQQQLAALTTTPPPSYAPTGNPPCPAAPSASTNKGKGKGGGGGILGRLVLIVAGEIGPQFGCSEQIAQLRYSYSSHTSIALGISAEVDDHSIHLIRIVPWFCYQFPSSFSPLFCLCFLTAVGFISSVADLLPRPHHLAVFSSIFYS